MGSSAMIDKQAWNQALAEFPQPPLLQTWEWGEVKAKFGWKPHHWVWRDDGAVVALALVLERAVNLPGMAASLRMFYVPKGPLLKDWSNTGLRKQMIGDLVRFAKERRAFLLKIDPDVPLEVGEPGSEETRARLVGEVFLNELQSSGWRYSNEQVQFKNSVFVDLLATEDEILARMKQKTRYNIRLAERKGVSVRKGTTADFEMLYQMYAETAVRDGFTIRGKDYYLTVWETYFEAGMLTPLIAEVEGEPVAGLMLFHFGRVAWYLYGMSLPVHREKMPTYLLQWEAMRAAKEKGCAAYDLWGAPEVFDEGDPLWGVYRFKRGLGGEVVRHIGAWDLPLRPWIYKLYTQVWPRLIEVMRRGGEAQTRQDLGL
jgi:lipid II:glycine glycyltransferase (peptidoglycan interpeptide bridge formation enzyme)